MKTHTIGLISDTHDLVRPEARRALMGAEHIIHAGDICSAHVLDALREIAPVSAVRGNNDRGPWAQQIPEERIVTIAGINIYVIHNIAQLNADLQAARITVVIYGRSHKPLIEEKDGVIFVNPGSAGPRRFRLPISAGLLSIRGTEVVAKLCDLA